MTGTAVRTTTVDTPAGAIRLAVAVDDAGERVVAAAFAYVVVTWRRGRRAVWDKLYAHALPIGSFLDRLDPALIRVQGTAVYMTGDPEVVPMALLHNIKHNHVLHERNIIVCVSVATRPFVPDAERIRITKLSDRFSRVDMCFGYMEETNVPRALALARKQGEKFDIMSTSFFLNRRTFRPSKHQGLPSWQELWEVPQLTKT